MLQQQPYAQILMYHWPIHPIVVVASVLVTLGESNTVKEHSKALGITPQAMEFQTFTLNRTYMLAYRLYGALTFSAKPHHNRSGNGTAPTTKKLSCTNGLFIPLQLWLVSK